MTEDELSVPALAVLQRKWRDTLPGLAVRAPEYRLWVWEREAKGLGSEDEGWRQARRRQSAAGWTDTPSGCGPLPTSPSGCMAPLAGGNHPNPSHLPVDTELVPRSQKGHSQARAGQALSQ